MGMEVSVEERHEPGAERLTAHHPLEVAATSMVIRSVQATSGYPFNQPVEQRLVIGVHPERHVGLSAVPAEVPLSDQHTDQEAGVEGLQVLRIRSELRPSHGFVLIECCFTVR
jgi:hypothetical protein